MTNFEIKINLAKLPKVMKTKIQGGETCIVIPIKENSIFEGKNGLYISLLAYETKEIRFGETHFLKLNIEKNIYNKMTEEERRNQQILGSLKPLEFTSHLDELSEVKLADINEIITATKPQEPTEEKPLEDLPF